MASLAPSRLRLVSSSSTRLHHQPGFPPHRPASLSFSSFSTSIPGFGTGVALERQKQRSSFVETAAVRHLVGSLTRAEGLRFAVVVARFNEIVTKQLLEGALETFKRYSVKEEDIDVVWVPGSFEIGLVAERLGKSRNYHAILCIGAVIRGDTTHYDAVANSAASGVLSAGINSGMAGGEGSRKRKKEREISRKVKEMKRSELLQTPGHEPGETQGGPLRPSGPPIAEAVRSPPRREEPPRPPPVAPSTEGGPSRPSARPPSRGAQMLIASLENNRTVRKNPGFAKVLGSSICLREDRDRLSPDNLDDILTRSMSLNVECLVNQHVVREKAHRLDKEVEKKSQEVASLRSQLSSAQDYISQIEGRMKYYEDKLAEQTHVLAERDHALGEVQALRANEAAQVAHLTEELKAKDEEMVTGIAGAYVNAHKDLLAELQKRYPEEDFSWMADLAPGGEEESDEEAEGERENEQNVD